MKKPKNYQKNIKLLKTDTGKFFEVVNMIKFEDGRIGFNSTLEHRLVERARHQLKKAGIKNIKTQYHDPFVYIMKGEYNSKTIKIRILMRTVETNNVAMNMNSYNCDLYLGINSLLVFVDRRHLYPVKFMWFNNINS